MSEKTYMIVRKCKAAVTETYKPTGSPKTPQQALAMYERGERDLDECIVEDILDETDIWVEITDVESGITTQYCP